MGTSVPDIVGNGMEAGGTDELEHANVSNARIAVIGAKAIIDLDRNIKGLCLGIYSGLTLYREKLCFP